MGVPFSPGQKFGQYALIDQIAVGGMAEIYLAKTSGLAGFEKRCALKVIHRDYAQDTQFVQMLIDEAKIAVGLTHANIAQIFELGRFQHTYYIAMEYIDGADLFRIMRRLSEASTSVPIDVATFIAQEICAGLDYAHSRRDKNGNPNSIIHRDISPQNILISRAGEVKIVDFGIAKANSRSGQTQTGVLKGKYFYMSPEQARGEAIDQRTDIFSAGIVLYEVLTGRMLYLEQDLGKLLDMARQAAIPSPAQVRPDIPPKLEQIIMRALSRHPDSRWQTARSFQIALTDFLSTHTPDFTPRRLAQMVNAVLDDDDSIDRAEPLQLPSGDLSTPPEVRGRRNARPLSVHHSDGLHAFDDVTVPTTRELDVDDDGEKTRVSGPPAVLLEAELPPGREMASNEAVQFTEVFANSSSQIPRRAPAAASPDQLPGRVQPLSWPPNTGAHARAPSSPPVALGVKASGVTGQSPSWSGSNQPEAYLAETLRASRSRLPATVIATVIALSAAAGTAYYVWPRSAPEMTLEVVSVPAGATVRINGRKAPQKTPIQRLIVPDATHPQQITVSLDRYETWGTVTSFSNDETHKKIIASLVPKSGRVTVESEPPGANLYVNRMLRGRTPIEIYGLPLTKPFTFQLLKRGFRTVTRTVRWRGQTSRTLTVTLVERNVPQNTPKQAIQMLPQ